MKKIIEIDIKSMDHLTQAHIMSEAKRATNLSYNLKTVKVRNFNTPDGKYNVDGHFKSVKSFVNNSNNIIEACYSELIEVELTMKSL